MKGVKVQYTPGPAPNHEMLAAQNFIQSLFDTSYHRKKPKPRGKEKHIPVDFTKLVSKAPTLPAV
jgi:hypothetical protein